MSFNSTHLSILFTDISARTQVQEWFEILFGSAQNFNKKMAELGVKTKFKNENPYLERMRDSESFLELEFAHDSSFRFPSALTKKLPGAILIVQTEANDYNLSGKKTYTYQGQTLKKDQLIECIDTLDSRVAMVLASQLGMTLATKYFKALDNPNEEFAGVLMFWHLIGYVNQYPAVAKLLQKCDVARLTSRGENALHYAAKTYGRCGDADIVWLLSQGCDVNAINIDGDTPLLVASRLGDKRNDGMYTFLSHGANPNIRDKNNLTALHHYCATGHWLDWLGEFEQCGVDFNADSPMGSPLWIANAAKRYEARKQLWAKNLVLSYPKNAYGKDAYENLLIATKHHDLQSMDLYIRNLQLNESQIQTLYYYACYFQCGALFDHLQSVQSWQLVADTADTLFDKDYILNHLDLLDDEHPAVGDSYRMFVTVIEQSSAEQVHVLAQTRDFAINCQRVVEWRSQQAVEFFQMLKAKSVVLEELFLEKNLWLSWHDEADIPKNISNVLFALREMGVVFHESANQLKSIGINDDLVKRLCNS